MNLNLKKLFCRHDYHKVDWEMAMDYRRNEVYSVRTYVCSKCGKKILVDGRYDPYIL